MNAHRPRVRSVVAALALALVTTVTGALPPAAQLTDPLPAPVRDALRPMAVYAGTPCSNYSADYPLLTGHLSNSAGTLLTQTTTGTVYGRISNVNQSWDLYDCYAYRYDAVLWATNNSTTALRVHWGLLAGDGNACRYLVGTADYLHANSGACPSPETVARLVVSLTPEAVYHNDSALNNTGDFAFAHSDCSTNYGAEPVKTGASTGVTSGKPGANCGNKALDATGTTQALVYDKTAPTAEPTGQGTTGLTIGAANPAYVPSPAVTLYLAAQDLVAGGIQMRVSNDNTSWSAWQAYATTKAWSLASGAGARTVYVQYRDALANTSASFSDGTILDSALPTVDFATPNELSTTIGSATFAAEAPTRVWVERPAVNPIATAYDLLAQNDPYARIASVWRDYPEGAAQIEQRTVWSSAFPTEPASVTENAGAVLGTPARAVTTTYVANSLALVEKVVEPLTASTSRWTEYIYNANNDVTQKTVSADGSPSLRTVTRFCYTTQSLTCPTTETGLTLVRQIENWVSGGAADDDTNVATDYTYDAFGRQTRVTRHNRSADGSARDDRVDALVYDPGNLGNLEKTITNFVDGAVTDSTLDTTPGADSVRTDLTTIYSHDTAGNRVSSADPRRAIGLAIPATATYTFSPTDDAHVRGEATTTNYGADPTLQVRGAGGSQGAYDPYLRFTVTGLVGTVTSATLRLQNTATTNRSGRNVCAFRVPTTTFTESAVTWATKPASDAGALACVTGNQAAGPIDYTVTSAVPGPGIYAFRLTNDTAFEVIYASKEHATLADPQLLVTVSYGPLAADDWITRWTYDALGRRLTETSPKTFGLADQKTATTTYDERGAVRAAVDFNGLLTTGTEVDRAGRATRTFEDTDAGGATAPAVTSITTYDPAGLVLTAKDRNQAATSALGYTKHEYDSLGRLALATDAAGSTPDVTSDTLTGYDALDRATLASYGGLDTVTTFDLGGRTLSVDDDFTCSTSAYDYRDLVTSTTSGLTGGTCAPAANTRTVTHSLDGLGRTVRSEVTAGAGTGDRTTDVSLDSAGNTLTSGARRAGVVTTTTFTVNRLDRTVAEVRPDGSTTKTPYDPAANATERCYWTPGIPVGDCLVVGTPAWTDPPTQNTSTTYDARNSRIQLVDGLTNGVTVYDPDHTYQPRAAYLPTGQGREFQTLSSYDSRHRLTTVTHQLCVLANPTTHTCSSATAAGSDVYAYDDNDNRTSVNEHNGATGADRRYCYDARDQLVLRNTGAACSSTAKDEANVYDDAGNRTSALAGAVTTNFAYTGDGQLCDVETAPTAASCTGGNVSYDSAGRTQAYAGWTFAYDSQGRMTSACRSPTCAAGFDKVEFAYDGQGHRTRITTTSAAGEVATREFRYQGDAIVAEQLTDPAHPAPGTVVRTYVVDDAGSIVKMTIPAGEAGAGTYLPTWSGHGDAMALWRQEPDGTLTLANSYTYDTWGRPTTTTHNGVPDLGFRFLYVGEFDVQWDDAFGLGLAYMHARHYHPTLGRFLQPDPDGSEANLYAYTANNPVTEMDPDGTCFILCIAVGVVLFGGLGAGAGALRYSTGTEPWLDRSDSLGDAAAGAFIGAGSYAIGGPGLGAGVKILSKVPGAARVLRSVTRAELLSSCVETPFRLDVIRPLAPPPPVVA